MTPEMLTDAQDIVISGIENNCTPSLNMEVELIGNKEIIFFCNDRMLQNILRIIWIKN